MTVENSCVSVSCESQAFRALSSIHLDWLDSIWADWADVTREMDSIWARIWANCDSPRSVCRKLDLLPTQVNPKQASMTSVSCLCLTAQVLVRASRCRFECLAIYGARTHTHTHTRRIEYCGRIWNFSRFHVQLLSFERMSKQATQWTRSVI